MSIAASAIDDENFDNLGQEIITDSDPAVKKPSRVIN
jgi:hypothetical protein